MQKSDLLFAAWRSLCPRHRYQEEKRDMGWFTRKKEDKSTVRGDAGRRKPAVSDSMTEPQPPAAVRSEPDSTRPGIERKVPNELADFFLVMEDHLTEVEREDVAEIVARLRQPPPILERVTRGLDDPEALAEAVKSNPALTADILRTVNSAAFALSAPISSIQHAITYLGTSLVKGLVLQSTVNRVMEFEHTSQQDAYMRLWRSSYVASTTALMLGQHLGMAHPSILSTRSLLANLGDLALLSARADMAGLYAPKATLFSRAKAQQDDLMANAAVISGMLVEQWGLPEALIRGLQHGYIPMALPPAQHPDIDGDLAAAVICYVAERIGDQVAFHGITDIGDVDLAAQEALEYFYLPDYLMASDMPGIQTALGDAAVRRRVNHLISTLGRD